MACRQPWPEERLHDGDERRHSAQRLMLLHEPARPPIPPGQRGGERIEAAAGQGEHRFARRGLGLSDEGQIGAVSAKLADEVAPEGCRRRLGLQHAQPPQSRRRPAGDERLSEEGQGVGAFRRVQARLDGLGDGPTVTWVHRRAADHIESVGTRGHPGMSGRQTMERQVHEQLQAMRLSLAREGLEHRLRLSAAKRCMGAGVVGREEDVAVGGWQEDRRDQHRVEAKRGGASEMGVEAFPHAQQRNVKVVYPSRRERTALLRAHLHPVSFGPR